MSDAIIRPRTESRWYYQDGRPCYELPKKKGGGMKKTTLADARKLHLVPSVTTILRVVYKPQLQAWITAQSVMAVLTSVRKEGEALDDFVERILEVERVQEEEADKAAEKGRKIHEAIMDAIEGKPVDTEWKPYVEQAFEFINKLGLVRATEKVLVGPDFAGRADVILENDHFVTIPDFKTTKTLPEKDSWKDHKMQTAAYACALGNTGGKRVLTANLYLSTKEPGKSAYFVQEDWRWTYEQGFRHAVGLWQYVNEYIPSKEGAVA